MFKKVTLGGENVINRSVSIFKNMSAIYWVPFQC